MFLSIVGAEAGHMALRSLASGGIYICGGIFPKVGRGQVVAAGVYACMYAVMTHACVADGRPRAGDSTSHPSPHLHPTLQVIERVKAGGVLEAFLWRASRFHDKASAGPSVLRAC